MGQQQLLLLILGVIIVGIAIAVGVTMFSAQSTEANKDIRRWSSFVFRLFSPGEVAI
jgi:hypothetical protein